MAQGRVSGRLEPYAEFTTLDGLGRPIRHQTPDAPAGSVVDHRAIAGSGPLAGTVFDGLLIKNGKGDLTQRLIDGDRVVRVDECSLTVPATATSLDGAGCGAADSTLYTYEGSGEISTIFDARAVAEQTWSDPNRYLRYSYDTLGRPIRIEDPDLEGPGFTATFYDVAGQVESVVNARGQQRSFTYDELDRLTAVTTPAGEDDYTVEYRPAELQASTESSPAYSRTYTYDALGRLQREELTVEWRTFLTDYAYDLLGQVTQIVHPDDETIVRYEYQGRYLQRVCDLGTASDCSGTGATSYVSDVEYDALGRRKNTSWPGGTRTFQFDPNTHRLTQDRFDGASSGQPYWFERNYDVYDELGNLREISGATLPGDATVAESYTYDQRNRLATWVKDGVSYAYGYDSLGNLTTHANEAQAFDDPGRPHAIQERVGSGVQYSYDDDGNATSIIGAGSSRYLKFDSSNRLACAGTSPGSCGLRSYRYDVSGNRILAKKSFSVFDVYVNDSYVYRKESATTVISDVEIFAFGERIALKRLEPYLRTAGAGIVLRPQDLWPLGLAGLLGLATWLARRGALVLIVRRPGYSMLAILVIVSIATPPVSLAQSGGGAVYYWELMDPLGTGMVLVDQSGARVRHTLFKPFGGEYQTAGTTLATVRRIYAGHRREKDLDLYYMGARWYDAASGAFLSIDPLVPDVEDPQSHNSYAYARNNPVRYVDPFGTHPTDLVRYEYEGGIQTFTFTPVPSFNTLPSSSGGVSFAGYFGSAGVGMSGFASGPGEGGNGSRVSQSDPIVVADAGPNGGERSEADQRRTDEQRERRRIRRENRSRDAVGENRSGEGSRDHTQARKGPSGVRPSGPGPGGRERNVGIDDEHSRVPKGSRGLPRRVPGTRGVRGAFGAAGVLIDIGIEALDQVFPPEDPCGDCI